MIYKMKRLVTGISYLYEITSVQKRNKHHFSIRATHKSSKRSSVITTINLFLSEFDIPESDKNFKESIWIVDKKKAIFLVKATIHLLSDQNYQKYLEKFLYEDRNQSEWENIVV